MVENDAGDSESDACCGEYIASGGGENDANGGDMLLMAMVKMLSDVVEYDASGSESVV